MKIHNNPFELDGTDMTAAITSEPEYVGEIINYSIQLAFTGTPDGDFIIEASNDEVKSTKNVVPSDITNWTQVSTTEVTAAGNVLIQVADITYQWIRLKWVDTASGSPSTITSAIYFMKGI